MQNEKLTPEQVVEELSSLLEGRLSTIYRFGSQFASKPGLVRLLVLVDTIDRNLLDRLTPLVGRCQASDIRLRLDTSKDILRAADAFPVFCLEFRETRELLKGEDVLTELSVDLSSLRLRVEQGLRVVRRDMVQAYLDQTDAGLATALRRATHRLVYLLEGVLKVSGAETLQRTPAEVFETAASTLLSADDVGVWKRLHEFGSLEATLDDDALLELYADVVRTLGPVVDAVDAMETAVTD
ncbi:MAG: hypothetical protein JKY65_11995 [Planctomycetes bacterium]|nr:hypothetical protein [Planctomycetota bacterium]